MTTTFTAVYRGGAFHPTTSPPDLVDGASVTLTVAADPTSPPDPLHPADVLARIRAIAALSDPTAPVEAVAANHDKYLYGTIGDRGDVR